ncbi:MAG: D-glycero-alpha-D-manno-heptose-1,7-bisphosphate 7-phosphatase [Sulfobacillus sp.]
MSSHDRAVFLDRDGTLIDHVPYLSRPEQIQLLEGTVPGLRLLRSEGYQLFIVSNQSGVARGFFTLEDLAEVHAALTAELASHGIRVESTRYCPHHPDAKCLCRKPSPGLLVDLAEEYGINLVRSWMVGDQQSDVAAGKRAGCRTILLGTRMPSMSEDQPDFISPDILGASRLMALQHT